MPHIIKPGIHELDRNQSLIAHLTNTTYSLPKLWPAVSDYEAIKVWQSEPYICIAPASVWFTKQYPAERWAELINNLPTNIVVYLIGGPPDNATCQSVEKQTNFAGKLLNLAGKLSLLQSAALMQGAIINYVNDSGPLHIATAMQAKVVAVFCSTVSDFGFGPVGNLGTLVQTRENLPCRPCGLHGHRTCPEKHFKCATTIILNDLLAPLPVSNRA